MAYDGSNKMPIHNLLYNFGGTIVNDSIVYERIDEECSYPFWQDLGYQGSLEEFKDARYKTNTKFDEISDRVNVSRTLWAELLAEELSIAISEDQALQAYQNFLDYYKNNVVLNEGVRNALKRFSAKNLNQYLVAWNWTEVAPLLEELNIAEYFERVLSSQDLPNNHERAFPFQVIIEEDDLSPDHCLMIGDDLRYDNACRSIGIDFCWFTSEENPSWNRKLDYAISSFSELEDLVENPNRI